MAWLWKVLLVSTLCGSFYSARCHDDNQSLLILVIFDGFRYDYLEKTSLPNFERLVQNGAKPVSVVPAFTTKTFPGHHTIATGLYQESHGIIGKFIIETCI